MIGWLDASSGVSGDMLLGAFVDAGVPVAVPQQAIDRLGLPEPVTLTPEPVLRAGIAATRVRVEVPETDHHRRLADIETLLERLDPPVREPAARTFRLLAEAEGRVHRMPAAEVHFHEVGALDSIADVVGVSAAAHHLGLEHLTCGPIALGGGRVRAAHGSIPVPAPAVVELLRRDGVPSHGGPLDRELATPTGVALAITLCDAFGPLPGLVPTTVGAGAGSADPERHANVLRLLAGEPTTPGIDPDIDAGIDAGTGPSSGTEQACVLEANVDDLDPRLWPRVLELLLDAGADDAWLTPIAMKKGRPASTVAVLCAPERADRLGRLLLAHTSTIGLRRTSVDKLPLPRASVTVDVLGSPVRIKVARLGGEVVNVSPEYDDVARVAVEQDLPEKVVLDAARSAAAHLWR